MGINTIISESYLYMTSRSIEHIPGHTYERTHARTHTNTHINK